MVIGRLRQSQCPQLSPAPNCSRIAPNLLSLRTQSCTVALALLLASDVRGARPSSGGDAIAPSAVGDPRRGARPACVPKNAHDVLRTFEHGRAVPRGRRVRGGWSALRVLGDASTGRAGLALRIVRACASGLTSARPAMCRSPSASDTARASARRCAPGAGFSRRMQGLLTGARPRCPPALPRA
jgi:hypothetical protein